MPYLSQRSRCGAGNGLPFLQSGIQQENRGCIVLICLLFQCLAHHDSLNNSWLYQKSGSVLHCCYFSILKGIFEEKKFPWLSVFWKSILRPGKSGWDNSRIWPMWIFWWSYLYVNQFTICPGVIAHLQSGGEGDADHRIWLNVNDF